jgi:hypothetical protein
LDDLAQQLVKWAERGKIPTLSGNEQWFLSSSSIADSPYRKKQ